ncbi:MAG: isoleucine--tRNA ligase [Bacteroidales bacterium]|nr:isoleucine--tRNA ligase [Bacteroidales bacterium]
MTFKEYKGLDLVSIGNDILDRWKKNGAFEKSLKLREGAPEFVFFEGPPSANGKPGIHHVMARSIKDAVCRYKTQTGYKVNRRAGWDTHGLPVEIGVEKKLGIHKEDIGTKISVEEYNRTCREEVMKYTAEWESMTERVGYWVDMNDPYITYDNRYIETLWYLLKDIYDKGLLYKGYSIQPYSPSDGTGLSSHELNQPGCYKDVTDTTATVQFEVVRDSKSESLYAGDDVPVFFLAWTTTPWTLPSNVALCVGPKIDYIRVLSFNPYTGRKAVYVLAKELLGAWFNPKAADIALEDYKPGDKLVPYKVLDGSYKGSELVGIRYKQLIPWFSAIDEGEPFRVISGDYVTTEDGTGIVHIAPTFGADDKKVAANFGVPGIIVIDKDGKRQAQVDHEGRFYPLENLDPEYVAKYVDPSYKEFSGRYVKNAFDDSLPADAPTLDVDLCMMMKQDGRCFKIQKHTHSYPHSWRTDKPVLYYPLDAWFIKTTAVKDEMVALNKTINWKPESTGTGRFGQWLENIQDWNLSRSRFWGTPLPIWRTEDGKEEICIGTAAQLYEEIDKAVAAGIMATNPFRDNGFDPADMSKENYDRIDLHRPYVDNIFLVSPSGKKMTRESDLIDVWFDSGAMPYAQEGLRGKDSWKFGCTSDFIAEGVDQTRGWFYTLHAIHTMVSGTPAFKTVISNGLVLDKNGNKMSKRLGNAVDPFEELDKYGADALRWYMLTNAQPWDNLKFDEAGVDEVRRKFFGTLYNTYSFFALYANVDGFDPAAPKVDYSRRPEIDRWIISLLNTLEQKVRAAYEDYDITSAGRMIQDFVCDDLSNWYVRLNRKRFWGGRMDEDKLAAYQTLYEVLVDVAVMAAPIAPFFMDRLYLDLVPAGEESVHYVLMPEYDPAVIDKDLEERMALAQKATSMVLALRRKVSIKVRQPLSKLVIPVISDKVREQLEQVKGIILSEVNVKEAEFISDTTGIITKKIKPNFKTLGKTYGKQMKEIAGAFAQFDQTVISAIQNAEAAGEAYSLSLPSGEVSLNPGDYEISSEDMPGWLVATEGQLTIALDIQISDDLRKEGIARELINRIQNLRKDSGFEVTDKIEVAIFADETARKEIGSSLEGYKEYIAAQTLAVSIDLESIADAPAGAADVEWDEGELRIVLKKINDLNNLRAMSEQVKANTSSQEVEKTRYSDEELAEFKVIIKDKLEKARKEYDTLRKVIMHNGSNDIEDTTPSFKTVEDDGAYQLSKEEASQLAQRQYKFIQNLEAALVRIENKTYGVCRVTGKLIPKERLRLVPHATLTVEAKEMLAKKGQN